MDVVLFIKSEIRNLVVQFVRNLHLYSIKAVRKNLPIRWNIFGSMLSHYRSIYHVQWLKIKIIEWTNKTKLIYSYRVRTRFDQTRKCGVEKVEVTFEHRKLFHVSHQKAQVDISDVYNFPKITVLHAFLKHGYRYLLTSKNHESVRKLAANTPWDCLVAVSPFRNQNLQKNQSEREVWCCNRRWYTFCCLRCKISSWIWCTACNEWIWELVITMVHISYGNKFAAMTHCRDNEEKCAKHKFHSF